MTLLLFAVGLLAVSAVASLGARRSRSWSTRLGVGGAAAAAAVGLVPTLRVLGAGASESLRWPWAVPYGAFFVEVDVLSAVFLLPIFVLSGLAAIYGGEYLRAARHPRSPAAAWFFFNLLVASMVLVVLARNAVLFLVAWEVMALASFFLVTSDDEVESVRDAGRTYLIATHLGTACILALFMLLGRGGASLDFDRLDGTAAPGLLFLLAVVGFGAKAGFVPLHVWLPEAHPAAPSHVSALMSGVMIKTGIYGLLRILTLLGHPEPWWGFVLCGIGILSGIGGVLFALAQHDLKRLLAYSSVENIGIIAIGVGLGVLGRSLDLPAVAVLGFAGALLHVWNHALFKGLLFLGAGAVAHATGTRELDELGGLLKRMPRTGLVFFVGALAIAALPPLNGLVSEILIYLGAYHALVSSAQDSVTVGAVCVIGALALIGGLAVACFTQAFGVVFLGEPRSADASQARDPGRAMLWPMYALAAGCVLGGLLAPFVVRSLAPSLVALTRFAPDVVAAHVTSAATVCTRVAFAGVGLLALAAALATCRRALLAKRPVVTGLTWDCGYARPTARMEYTASSFAQPLTELFGHVLRARRRLLPPQGLFPRDAALATDTPDVVLAHVYTPLFAGLSRGLAALRWLQHGRVHLYVLYIALTLLALLVWKLG